MIQEFGFDQLSDDQMETFSIEPRILVAIVPIFVAGVTRLVVSWGAKKLLKK